MVYEQKHITMYNKYDKKKTVTFTAETTDIGEEVDEQQSEEMALINRGFKQILRQ